MSVLESIQSALTGVGQFGLGNYPDSKPGGVSGKIVFAGGVGVYETDKPRKVMGGGVICTEVFKVAMRGPDYLILESRLNAAKTALKKAEFVQVSGFEHIETSDGEPLQLAVSFKSL